MRQDIDKANSFLRSFGFLRFSRPNYQQQQLFGSGSGAYSRVLRAEEHHLKQALHPGWLEKVQKRVQDLKCTLKKICLRLKKRGYVTKPFSFGKRKENRSIRPSGFQPKFNITENKHGYLPFLRHGRKDFFTKPLRFGKRTEKKSIIPPSLKIQKIQFLPNFSPLNTFRLYFNRFAKKSKINWNDRMDQSRMRLSKVMAKICPGFLDLKLLQCSV